MSATPKGFTCECSTFHRYSSYVYAHWRDRLFHTCEQCGAKHAIVCGVAFLQKPRKRSKKVKI